jgi:membrane-associated protein
MAGSAAFAHRSTRGFVSITGRNREGCYRDGVESASWQRVLDLASTYGYAFLFFISVAENTFLLGIVVPGDVAVVLGGALASQGRLSPVTTTLVVVAGVVLGSNLSFWVGRRGGIPLIERWGGRFSMEKAQIDRVERYFVRHGAKTVFLASFVSGFKNLVPAVAGASSMGLGPFILYNAVGSVLRAVALVVVGYIFGANLPRAVEMIGSLNRWLIAAILGLFAVMFVIGWYRRRRQARESGGNGQDHVDRGASP